MGVELSQKSEKLVRSIYTEDFITLHRPVFDEQVAKGIYETTVNLAYSVPI